MKIYLLSLFLISSGLFISCSKNNDLNSFGLKGNVNTYLEKYYEPVMKFGEWGKGKIKNFGHNKYSFDKTGNYQWIEFLDDSNQLSYKLIPTREDGKIVEESYYDNDGSLLLKSKFTHISNSEFKFITYNKEGNKTSQGRALYMNNKIKYQDFQSFENNKIVDEYKTTFEYDKYGNLLSRKRSNKKGEITYFIKFKYLSFDKNNNWTKRLEYDSEKSEEPNTIVIREYDYY